MRVTSVVARVTVAVVCLVSGACVGDDPTIGGASGGTGEGGTSSGGVASLEQAPVCEGRVACARLVFATSNEYTGKLGGVSGADALCQQAAQGSSLAFVRQRTFLAWIGTLESSPKDRLTNGTQEYRRTDGEVAAGSFADLTGGRLRAPIDRDENGAEVGGLVWTGTEPDGTGVVHECGLWATESGSAFAGNTTKVDDGWASRSELSCSMKARLYCFER